MNTIQLVNDDYKGHVEHTRNASRGILLKDGKILLCYESKGNKYIIPGGGVEKEESLEQCCERELLEETGIKARAKNNYLKIEESFDVWKHVNYYFICEIISDTGKQNLTEAEKDAGYIKKWLPFEDAIKIFGAYESFHKSNIADYGLYRREYNALIAARDFLKAQ